MLLCEGELALLHASSNLNIKKNLINVKKNNNKDSSCFIFTKIVFIQIPCLHFCENNQIISTSHIITSTHEMTMNKRVNMTSLIFINQVYLILSHSFHNSSVLDRFSPQTYRNNLQLIYH